MGILGSLLNRAPLEVFAKQLAEDVARRFPPELDKEPGKRPSVNRLTRIIEDVCKKAVDFKVAHRLGWLGKARLGNAFRWELRSMGYQKDFIDLATEAVIVHLSRKAPPVVEKES